MRHRGSVSFLVFLVGLSCSKDECSSSDGLVQKDDNMIFLCSKVSTVFNQHYTKRYLDYSCEKGGYSTVIDDNSFVYGVRCVNIFGDLLINNDKKYSGGLYCGKNIVEKWIKIELALFPRQVYFYCSEEESYTIHPPQSYHELREDDAYDELPLLDCGPNLEASLSEDRENIECL